MLDTFLFDLDGTLIDSIGLIRSSYAHALRAHGLPPLAESEWLAGLGRPLAWQFGRLTADAREVEALIASYREHNLAHHDASVRAYAGAVEAVRALRAAGGRLAIVTSKQHKSALRGLAHCGFEGLFEVVIGMDDVAQHKPDPAPVVEALRRLGARAQQAVMVGDSPHDLASGRAAGTRTAAVAWGPFPRAWLDEQAPDVWLAEPAQIAGLARAAGPSRDRAP